MGWKNVKEHYDIKHIVQVGVRREYGDGPCIMIGSPFISDIIVIRVSDGKILKPYNDRSSLVLKTLQQRLDEDEKDGVLKALIDSEDTFGRLLPVYCIDDGRNIVKMWCEAYGYPNVTTEGMLMYENTFYSQLRAAKYHLMRRSRIRWRDWWEFVCNRLREAWDRIMCLKWSFKDIADCIHVRIWGIFFIKNDKK